jgi:hypothetical protein
MDDAMLTAVVAAVAARTVEGLTDAARAAFTSLMRLVGNKLGDEPSSAARLAAAQADPLDAERLAALRAELQRVVTGNPQFAAELSAAWLQVRPATHASDGGVANAVTGNVSGHLVQARDIDGGVSFGSGAVGRECDS